MSDKTRNRVVDELIVYNASALIKLCDRLKSVIFFCTFVVEVFLGSSTHT